MTVFDIGFYWSPLILPIFSLVYDGSKYAQLSLRTPPRSSRPSCNHAGLRTPRCGPASARSSACWTPSSWRSLHHPLRSQTRTRRSRKTQRRRWAARAPRSPPSFPVRQASSRSSAICSPRRRGAAMGRHDPRPPIMPLRRFSLVL